MSELYVGLMSGTSLDGVDAVLVDFSSNRPTVLAHSSAPFKASLKSELLALNTSSGNELHRAALAANQLVQVYAEQVRRLLSKAGTPPEHVQAIGAHGQTVRHRPGEFDGLGYTLQLNQPALLAELTGIDVIADFRSRDVAAGGQGAPLVPPFHKAFFGHISASLAVLNIGGISNITLLDPTLPDGLTGFDCGPGNALMDAWCLQHTGAPFDDAGRWAASGRIQQGPLERMLGEPFFGKPPPKSTGRDLFNGPWLQGHLQAFDALKPEDVQATLTELTALGCAKALKRHLPHCPTLIVCGGGALNGYLMQRIQHSLPSCKVASSSEFGLPPLQVEATAFAWLARQNVMGETGSMESVTGARGRRILGALYPA